MIGRRGFLAAAAGGALAAAENDLTLVDAATGTPIAARLLVRDGSGHDWTPEDAVEVPIGPDRWFVADSRVRLPGTGYSIRAEHGTEYRPTKSGAGRIALERWIDMRARGYWSGDDHLHVPAGPLARMMAAEGLDFGASLEWWNGPKLTVPPDADTARISVHDAEVENAWGAVYLVGMRQPVSIAPESRRSNLAYVKEARRQGALVCYQGGWSREVLPDALAGLVDVVNVCNNNFHRYRFQPRAQFSNLLAVPGFPEYPNTAEGMMRLNFDSYYRLLNCGLQLAAGAESATGAKSTPAGYNRSYVKMGPRATIGAFYDAWRRGRNFVTNGPMIFLTANGSHEPGDTIALPKGGGAVDLRATALCDQPLQSLELVVNGEVVASGKSQAERRIELRESAWIAARTTADDRFLSDEELAHYRNDTGRGERPTRLRYGHTSPIYALVNDAVVRVAASVAEARAMLDGFEKFARAAAAPEWRPEVLETLATARTRLG